MWLSYCGSGIYRPLLRSRPFELHMLRALMAARMKPRVKLHGCARFTLPHGPGPPTARMLEICRWSIQTRSGRTASARDLRVGGRPEHPCMR